MAARERVSSQKAKIHRDGEEARKSETAGIDTEDLKAEMDDVLDEIDSVLEENAEEFVKAYVQKGGE